jgi:hypothetical protein
MNWFHSDRGKSLHDIMLVITIIIITDNCKMIITPVENWNKDFWKQ